MPDRTHPLLVSLLSESLAVYLFARGNSARGANVGASAAIYANFGVNLVDFALADSARGAFVDASATGNAVVTDYVSHFSSF